jgi:hypothetical protein
MDLSLANIDLNSNPYPGTEHDENKSLRDFALEMIIARRQNRSQLAQIARDMRRAVGSNGFHPELHQAVQAFIEFDVESAGGGGVLIWLALILGVKSLVPYRQCSAAIDCGSARLRVRSSVDTAICSKPLARWMYGY